MRYAILSVVAVAALFTVDSAANAQVVVGGGVGVRVGAVGVGVGVAPAYVVPAPVVVAPPVVYAQPAPVVVVPAAPVVSVGVGVPLFVGGYRPFYGHGYYRPYFRR